MPAGIKKILQAFFGQMQKRWVWQTVVSVLLGIMLWGLMQTGGESALLTTRTLVSVLSVENDWTPRIREVVSLNETGFELSDKLVLPVSGIVVKNFGWYSTPGQKNMSWHQGIDIKAEKGHPVKATALGTVEGITGNPIQGYRIVLKHSQDVSSIYENIGKLRIFVGQKVRKGEILGETVGFNVHFEIQVRGTPVDPLDRLRKNQSGI